MPFFKDGNFGQGKEIYKNYENQRLKERMQDFSSFAGLVCVKVLWACKCAKMCVGKEALGYYNSLKN